MAHKFRNLARAVQRSTGVPYTTALREVELRIEEIAAFRQKNPGMTTAKAAVVVCFPKDEHKST